MAAFSTLGSTTGPTNIGGSFNPATNAGAAGQTGPSGFGIQPPRVSSPYNVDALNLSAGTRPSQYSDVLNPTAGAFTPGSDTSPEHQANVSMAQGGFGNMGLRGNDPGTSYSAYGVSPEHWQQVIQYLMNPQGTNAATYQGLVNTIRSNMNGNPMFSQWLPNQFGPFASDFLLRMGGPFGVFPPVNSQSMQIPQTSPITGVRSF